MFFFVLVFLSFFYAYEMHDRGKWRVGSVFALPRRLDWRTAEGGEIWRIEFATLGTQVERGTRPGSWMMTMMVVLVLLLLLLALLLRNSPCKELIAAATVLAACSTASGGKMAPDARSTKRALRTRGQRERSRF